LSHTPYEERLGTVLAELNAAILRRRDRTEILASLCASARDLTGAEAATAMALDADDFFLVRAANGTVWTPGTRVPAADTPAGRALERPVFEAHHAEGGPRSVLYVPIPGYGRAHGVLGAAFRADRTSSVREVHLLTALAAPAAVVEAALVDAEADERAASRERERLARDLHDSVVQTLYGISLGAGTAGELLDHDPALAQQSIAWIRESAAAGLTDVRGIILRLQPEALGLTVALGRLLERPHLNASRISAQLGPEPSASDEVREALYRIAQEAVQNAAKHAAAQEVTLRLYDSGITIVLEVHDDGHGFDPGQEFRGRLGIRSMRTRAEAVGGTLEITSAPGEGTIVRARLPGSYAAGVRTTA
jgi:signal transduction histidine kinase